MPRNMERIYVWPAFKTQIKIEAAKKGKSVFEFTKDLSEESNALNEIANWDGKVKRIKRGFDFP